jgi:hypothetical protein
VSGVFGMTISFGFLRVFLFLILLVFVFVLFLLLIDEEGWFVCNEAVLLDLESFVLKR